MAWSSQGRAPCDASMLSIRERGLFEIIRHSIDSGKPFLGVCLGLQLLLESSEEGEEPCLAILKGSTKRLPPEKTDQVGLKIPHMAGTASPCQCSIPFSRESRTTPTSTSCIATMPTPRDKDIVAASRTTALTSAVRSHGTMWQPFSSTRRRAARSGCGCTAIS